MRGWVADVCIGGYRGGVWCPYRGVSEDGWCPTEDTGGAMWRR